MSLQSTGTPGPKSHARRKSSSTRPNILIQNLHFTPSSGISTSSLVKNPLSPPPPVRVCSSIEVIPPSPASSPTTAGTLINLAAKTPSTIRHQQQQNQNQRRRSTPKALSSRQRSSSSSALPTHSHSYPSVAAGVAAAASTVKQQQLTTAGTSSRPTTFQDQWQYLTPVSPSVHDSLTAPPSPEARSTQLRSLSSPHLADPYTTAASAFASAPGTPSVAPLTAPPSPLLTPISYASPPGSPFLQRRPSLSNHHHTRTQSSSSQSQSYTYPSYAFSYYPHYTRNSLSMDHVRALYHPHNGGAVMNRDDDSDDDGILMPASRNRMQSGGGGAGNHEANGSAYAQLRARARSENTMNPNLGEVTETEDERHPRSLPTARVPPSQQSHSSTISRERFRERHPILDRLTNPLLFLFRIFSVFPAAIGTFYNIYHVINPRHPDHSYPGNENTRVDYVVCILWTLLTAHQCYALAAGLYLRWKAYYDIPATLVRLLALQSICWPATHFTLRILDISRRPLVCWTVVGTTTCVSRAIQIWATSNLSGGAGNGAGGGSGNGGGVSGGAGGSHGHGHGHGSGLMSALMGGGKRKWDWWEIGWKCVAPAAVLHVVMAWALLLRIELGVDGTSSPDPLI